MAKQLPKEVAYLSKKDEKISHDVAEWLTDVVETSLCAIRYIDKIPDESRSFDDNGMRQMATALISMYGRLVAIGEISSKHKTDRVGINKSKMN